MHRKCNVFILPNTYVVCTLLKTPPRPIITPLKLIRKLPGTNNVFPKFLLSSEKVLPFLLILVIAHV